MRLMSPIDRPHVVWWISIIAGMTTLGVLAFDPPALAWWTAHLFWLPPAAVLIAVFIGAVALHVGEAAYAFRLASGVAPAAAIGWTLQTLTLGYPSLRLLKLRVAKAAGA
jgi:hypothetical protein